MTSYVALIAFLTAKASRLNGVIRSNGGFAMTFVVLMIGLNCVMLAAGTVLQVLGDGGLLQAAGQSATIVGPVLTAATAMLALAPRSANA